jgi:hypothetical protein
VADRDRLDAELRALAPWVALPPTPNVVAAVERAIAAPAGRRMRWRPAVLVAVAATLLLAAAVAAVALGLPGLRITLVESLPPVASLPADALDLGERVSVSDAARRATMDVRTPAALGEPDAAFVSADGDMVTLLYRAGPELPSLAMSEIGLLLMQIDGSVGPEHIEKLVLSKGASVQSIAVDRAPGYWIEGSPHALLYVDGEGNEREVRSRLVGDVLVWHQGGVLYRIESGLGLQRTLEIAQSLGTD